MAPPKQVLLLVETSREFGRGVIQGVARFARERANWIFQFEDRGILERLPSWLQNWRGDGIIARSPTRGLAKSIGQFCCPVVELLGDGRQLAAEVRTDEDQTARLAVDHLLQQGYPHLAFYSFANSWWSDARRDAFVRAARERGSVPHVFPGAYRGQQQPYPTWRQEFQGPLWRWLERVPKPVGIWSVADAQAIRLLEACRQLELPVPAEIGVLGTSNDEVVCSLLTPSLSSIELNPQEVGYRAAALLARKMTQRRSASRKRSVAPILVPPAEVVLRQSTDRLAIVDPELDQAVKIMERRAIHGLSVDQLARELSISRSTLERRFRAFFHCSPAQAINRVRIERAKALLRDTAWPVAVIGEHAGFRSPENFVRFFRRLVGTTPRRYRVDFFGDDPADA